MENQRILSSSTIKITSPRAVLSLSIEGIAGSKTSNTSLLTITTRADSFGPMQNLKNLQSYLSACASIAFLILNSPPLSVKHLEASSLSTRSFSTVEYLDGTGDGLSSSSTTSGERG